MKLSELTDKEKYVKICVYGPTGAGKTVYASGYPGPIYFADFDGKIESAANFLSKNNPSKLENIEFDNYQPSQENGAHKVFRKFEAQLLKLEAAAREGKFPFKTVVIDSLTSLSLCLMKAVMSENPTKRFNADTPAQQDYGIFNHILTNLITRLLSLPCNVVVIGHVVDKQDPITGETNYKVALSGQMADMLPKLFKEYHRAYSDTIEGKVVHIAQVRSGGRYICNTIYPQLPNKIPLSYEALHKAISGEIGIQK